MTDIEARLDHALKADAPPPRDPMFRIEILVRRERSALRRRLLTACATALGVAIPAALGFAAIGELVDSNALRLAMIAMAGIVLMVFLASSAGALPALSGVIGRWRARSSLWP